MAEFGAVTNRAAMAMASAQKAGGAGAVVAAFGQEGSGTL